MAVTLPPGLEFAALLHAMPLLGSLLVPVNTRDSQWTPDADVVIDAPLTGSEADIAPRRSRPRMTTWVILHTSGTTAAPKPVSLTYGNFRASAEAAASNLPLGPDDRWLCVMPLFHVGGLSILTRSAFAGSSVIVHERFDAEAGPGVARIRRGDGRVARGDDAPAPAGGRAASGTRLARGADRRRSGAGRPARLGRRGRPAAAPDLRHDRDLLADRDRRRGLDGRAAAARRRPADRRRRRDPRARADGLGRAPCPPTAGSTPATAAGSTTRASCTSPAGSRTRS